MTQDTLDIDRLVRRVLSDLGLAAPRASADQPPARLGGSSVGPAAQPPAGAPEQGEKQQQAPSPEPGDVVVGGRVVTLSALPERVGSARRLVVPLGAVVTPSVCDELRRRNIPLVFEEKKQAQPTGDAGVTLAVLGSRFDPSSLVEALTQEGMPPRLERFDCLVAATDAMAGRLARAERMGVVVSTYPAVALCLANRHAGVRAVLGLDPRQASADAASVGANLLVVDPRRASVYLLRQIVLDFCRAGARPCPGELKERLS